MQLLDVIETLGSPVTHMIVSTDDTFIIASCENNTVQVKSLITGSDVHHLEGHSSDVISLAVTNDSMCCYVGCHNGHIYVYNLRSRALLRTLKHHDSPVNDLYMSSDDYFLYSASDVRISLFHFDLFSIDQKFHFRIRSTF